MAKEVLKRGFKNEQMYTIAMRNILFYPKDNQQMSALFQGEAFSEFTEEYSSNNPPTVIEATRMINEQSEIIVENLNEMKNTVRDRRQTMLYLLEQCILISSALPTENIRERTQFRRIRRLVEKARRLTRRDQL
jgi:hypothetical protein